MRVQQQGSKAARFSEIAIILLGQTDKNEAFLKLSKPDTFSPSANFSLKLLLVLKLGSDGTVFIGRKWKAVPSW